MKKWLVNLVEKSTLDAKIRYTYVIVVIPFTLFLVFCFFMLWSNNRTHADMINSTAIASEFSLDFKKDFDYETYLLIVGNKSVDESALDGMLAEANRIVDGLLEFTESKDNLNRLNSVKKYLVNLETYTERIKQNLIDGSSYEQNMEIWENDVQIVTSLVRETIFQYIFYEVKGIQEAREAYQRRFMTLISVSLGVFALILVGILVFSYYISRSLTRPLRQIADVTDQVTKGDLTVRSEVREGAEIAALSDSMNAMIDKINELLSQVTQEQTRLRKAEFELLQSQINPHFLYNTLDAIVWLAESGEQKKVVKTVGSLSEFFRTSLNGGRDMVTVREELQHVRSYLEIQQVRYADILSYDIDVPEEMYSVNIPKITLQPLVENALYHGIKKKRGMGHILISGHLLDDGSAALVVQDDGYGMDEGRLQEVNHRLKGGAAPEGTGMFGLYNVNERIKLNFGVSYGLSAESTLGQGTGVTVRIPGYGEV